MGLTGKLWPYHPKPFDDEIFSSWLLRTALGNSSKLQSFCHYVWPHRQIWTRDIDRMTAPDLLETMALKTGTPRAGLENLFLQSYESSLFDKMNLNAPNPWIRYVGVRHRIRTRHGQLYCPLCLETDQIPYFRKIWRTNLSPVCLTHAVVLRDCCERCGSPIMPHRGEMLSCQECEYDLRDAKVWASDPEALNLAQALSARFSGQRLWGANIPNIEDNMEFFATVRAIIILFCSGRRTAWLRHEVSHYLSFNVKISANGTYDSQFECLRVNDLHQVFSLAAIMFRGWPWMFIGLCAEARMWKSWTLKDTKIKNVPNLTSIVQDYLFDPYQNRSGPNTT